MGDLRYLSVLNPLDEEFSGMCFSCQHYNDYGPVAGRFGDYNGRCKADNHETNALVRCSINKYKRLQDNSDEEKSNNSINKRHHH